MSKEELPAEPAPEAEGPMLEWFGIGETGVRAAPLPDGGVAVSDGNAVLCYTEAEWRAFADGMAKGEFDSLIIPPSS